MKLRRSVWVGSWLVRLAMVVLLFETCSSRSVWGQAAYVRDYHWIYGNGRAQLGSQVDSKGFWDGNETGVHYGFETVDEYGTDPQKAVLVFRSLSMPSALSWRGYCKSESSHGGVDAVGSVGGGITANCEYVASGFGSFMSVWDFDDTTFDYQLRCLVDTNSIDDGTTLSVRYGVAELKHGLKAVFDAFDAEWDLYGWFWTSNGYAWVHVPNTVAVLDYDLTGYGGPIGWGQLAVTDHTVNFRCTAINFGTVHDGRFRASVVAR